jgi:hypothetical protein
MPTHNPPNPDVDGCFEITLARGLTPYMGRLQIQEAVSQYRRMISRLGPRKRVELAAALQWEFRRRRSRVEHDEGSLHTLQHQYNQVRDLVTPIYRLPAEVLTEIFTIDFAHDQSPGRLMLVCRDWCLVVEGISVCQSLKLGTWTAPDRVERFLQRLWWLNIVIDTEKDAERREGDGEAYTALALVVANASRWRKLTIDSLPHGSPVPSSMGFPPISELKYLKVTSQAEPSPLLDRILENIGIAAVGSLSVMETTSYHTIRHLLQPTYIRLFHFLTTIKAHFRTTPDSVDLLPHISRVEVLDLTNISLLNYADDVDLPLTHSLHHLRLKAVSIQWMGGRRFPQLQSCSIYSPPSHPPLLSDVYFPICYELEFRNMEVAWQFQAPVIHSMTMKSNGWTPVRGSKQVILLCRAGLGIHLRPRVLHLSVLCDEGVLLSALRLLPALNELHLDITRPCVLGRRFFMALLAKTMYDPKGNVDRKWGSSLKPANIREPRICASLRRLELKYERWFRRTDQLDILPPLMAIGWSRRETATPLEYFSLCFQGSDTQWKVLKVPEDIYDLNIAALEIPRLELFQEFPSFFGSCVTATATSVLNLKHDMPHLKHGMPHLKGGMPDHLHQTLPLFESYFRQLSVLSIYHEYETTPTFDILPNFFQLVELQLFSVNIPSYSVNAGLPLFQTLLRLSLRSMTVTWMDGCVFTRLKRLHLETVSIDEPFSVSLPVCTHIKYNKGVDYLLQSMFHVPTLTELDRRENLFDGLSWKSNRVKGTLGLLPTRTLLLEDCFLIRPECFIAEITSIVELEVLMISDIHLEPIMALLTALGRTIAEIGVFTSRSADVTLDRNAYGGDAGTFSTGPRSLICPNLTQLALRIWEAGASEKEQISWQCEQMMDARRSAGQELECCCIWWGEDKTPSLVLGTSRDSVVVDGKFCQDHVGKLNGGL